MADAVLTFQVPAEQGVRVRRALLSAVTPARRLRLLCADTAGGDLAAAGLTLHLRHEGRRWTQVLSRAAGPPPRLEQAIPLPAQAGQVPVIDVHRHAHTAWRDALPPAVLEGGAAIEVQVQVRMERVQRTVRSGATRVQVTFDQGDVQRGKTRWPLCVVRFERLAGPPIGLVALAARWIERHGLYLVAGGWLHLAPGPAQPTETDSVTFAAASPLAPLLEPDAALRALVGSCLDHLLPNAARLAAGSGGPEHLHQTRVALRRLRTALRVLGHWSQGVDPQWNATLGEVFSRLGARRDRDALSASLLPALMAAGAPTVELPPASQTGSPADVLRGAACNRVLVELLAFSADAPLASDTDPELVNRPAADPMPATLARPLLNRLHRRIATEAEDFLNVDDAARHRTRKRLKRLRYSAEFVAPLFPSKAVARYLGPLRAAQDALGAFNDLAVAELAFRAQVEHDARAWFAVGWLAARRPACLLECRRALQDLAQAQRFWKT